ncbi:MAG: dipeptide epimerase [Bacteroidetes bacterium]|nr:MAG: dipeptide epimerase [Bacteroidota bacterium]
MKLSFAPYLLKFKRPFSIAHGSRDSTPVIFTRLDHEGVVGYGEASMPPYLGETHETALSFLSKAVNVLDKFRGDDNIAMILEEVDRMAHGNTAAKASIDIALHDLIGKIQNRSCHEMFGADRTKPVFTAYTIPMDEPEGIRTRVEEAQEYSILKVKMGSSDDKKLIEEIRKHTSKNIMVDANEGWKDKQAALEMVEWLSHRNVQMVEQPMPKEQVDDTAWLCERSAIPIIADEAVKRLSDIEKAKGIYTGINIKLMKSTGLHEAHKMIVQARKYGMKIMIGCMSETSCGVSAAAQLAPLADWIDLDGPLLIKEDYFSGVKFSAGKILLNDLAGIGVIPLKTLTGF